MSHLLIWVFIWNATSSFLREYIWKKKTTTKKQQKQKKNNNKKQKKQKQTHTHTNRMSSATKLLALYGFKKTVNPFI